MKGKINMKKPRMTLADVSNDLRARGMPLSKDKVSACIKSGAFPFATIINTGVSGRTTFLILRKDYEAWADEYLGQNYT